MEFKIENYNPVQTNTLDRKSKLKAKLWALVNTTIFRYSPFFMRRYRIFLINLFGGNVHASCSVNRKAIVDYPWNLEMHALSSLGENSWAYCLAKITIGEKSCIGKDVYLLTGAHEVGSPSFNLVTKPVTIKDGCWVSTGSYILPGVTLADFTVVAAGAVVSKDFEAFSIIGGNPAKFIKLRQFQ